MAWALRHYAKGDVDKIEWSIISGEGERLEFMRKFKAEFSVKNHVAYRLSGKAVLVNNHLNLLISERIDY